MESAGFKMVRLVIWQKTNPVPLNMRATYLSNSREMAVTGVKVGKRHNGNRMHPTQKPLLLFEDLVQKHSNTGDLVVDPFLGSGTTGAAAVRNARRFSGCDLDNNYVKIARERMKSE